jgi:hypothetical protein
MAHFTATTFLYCLTALITSVALAHPTGPHNNTTLVSERDDDGPPPIDFYTEDRQKSWTVWEVFLTSIVVMGALVAATAVIVTQIYCRRSQARRDRQETSLQT